LTDRPGRADPLLQSTAYKQPHVSGASAIDATTDGNATPDIRTQLTAEAAVYRQTRLQVCLHARHQAGRDNLLAALETLSGLRWLKQARRVRECASHGRVYVRQSNAGAQVGLWLSRCGHRCCPYCSQARSRRVESQIRAYLAGVESPRHIVLTRRHDDLPLSAQIKAMRAAFGRLRRSAWGKRHLLGGIYVVEVKLAADGRWHPHLHVVYDGLYIDQRELSRAWSQVVGGSPVVWINRARGGQARYLAKYVGKPAELASLSVDRLAEYVEATHGMRMVQPWGTAHGPQPSDGDPLLPPPPAAYAVPLSVIARSAAAGHVGAQQFVRALAARWPILRAWARAYADLDPPPPDQYTDDWRDRTEYRLAATLGYVLDVIDRHNGQGMQQFKGRRARDLRPAGLTSAPEIDALLNPEDRSKSL